METSNIFDSLKILELSSVLAGPLVGSFFSELGATVIKVENKKSGGDVTRSWRHPSEDEGKKVTDYYLSANQNKDILFLDLTIAEEYDQLCELVRWCDVVICNFPYNTGLKLRTLYNDIKIYNAELIFANLVAYNRKDLRTGFDVLMQAECGYISMCGEEEHPAKMPSPMIDILAAHHMKEAILIALLQKALGKTKTCEIEVSLFDAGLTGLANQGSSFLNSDILPSYLGTTHPTIAPYGDIFYSSDKIGFILAVGSDEQFKKLGFTINLSSDFMRKFESNISRVDGRNILHNELQNLFNLLSFKQTQTLLVGNKIPFGKINDLSALFELPQARQMVKKTSDNGKFVSNLAFKII
jgi:crotonobetainyl-CoA:carnitine CoA-transferase CaiB-like acyl-CoA transferase